MDILNYLVEAHDNFWKPCVIHKCPKRHYNLEDHMVYCDECFPDARGIKVYRNMLQNVIRVSKGDIFHAVGIQIYTSNKHRVAYLKPHKATTNVLATKLCYCGRGLNESSNYCSIECFLSHTKTSVFFKNQNEPRFATCRQIKNRRKSRKPRIVSPSPVS